MAPQLGIPCTPPPPRSGVSGRSCRSVAHSLDPPPPPGRRRALRGGRCVLRSSPLPLGASAPKMRTQRAVQRFSAKLRVESYRCASQRSCTVLRDRNDAEAGYARGLSGSCDNRLVSRSASARDGSPPAPTARSPLGCQLPCLATPCCQHTDGARNCPAGRCYPRRPSGRPAIASGAAATGAGARPAAAAARRWLVHRRCWLAARPAGPVAA